MEKLSCDVQLCSVLGRGLDREEQKWQEMSLSSRVLGEQELASGAPRAPQPKQSAPCELHQENPLHLSHWCALQGAGD